MTTNNPPKADVAKFLVTELIHSAPLKLHNDGVGSVELVRQKRRRESDGKFGREFLTVLVQTGRRPIAYDPAVVRQLHAVFGDMLGKMELEEKKMHAERVQAQAAWEEQIKGNNGDRKVRRTGKTERKRKNREAAGKPTDPAARKAVKSERDRTIRQQAQGLKGKG